MFKTSHRVHLLDALVTAKVYMSYKSHLTSFVEMLISKLLLTLLKNHSIVRFMFIIQVNKSCHDV